MTGLSVPRWTVTIGGADYEAEIAKVEAFHLGTEDHGLFVADIRFAGPGWGQGLAAHALDNYDEASRERVGTAFGMDYVIGLVRAVGSPETAKGKRVVVLREGPGHYGLIVGVAPLNDDGSIGAAFIPGVLANRHYPERVSA